MFGKKKQDQPVESNATDYFDPIETIININERKFISLIVSQLVFSSSTDATKIKSPRQILCTSTHQNLVGYVDFHCRGELERTIAFEPTHGDEIMCMIDLHETDFMALWNEFFEDRSVLLAIRAKFEEDLIEAGKLKIEFVPVQFTFDKRVVGNNFSLP
jgi:hypothetical protein